HLIGVRDIELYMVDPIYVHCQPLGMMGVSSTMCAGMVVLVEVVLGRPKASVTLWPPKANVLDSTSSTGPTLGVPRTWSRSQAGSGSSRLAVGGRIPRLTDSAATAASTTPDAPSRCPVNALIELTAGPCEPNTVLI